MPAMLQRESDRAAAAFVSSADLRQRTMHASVDLPSYESLATPCRIPSQSCLGAVVNIAPGRFFWRYFMKQFYENKFYFYRYSKRAGSLELFVIKGA